MYCPECGKNNPEGLQHCQYCHAELIDNAPQQLPNVDLEKYVSKVKNADYKSFFETLKAKKGTIIPIAVILILVIGVLIGGAVAASPDRLVKSYMEAYIAQDYEKMYDYMAIKESDFVNEETFANYMANYEQSDIPEIANYTINPQESQESYEMSGSNSLSKVYVVSYVLEGSGSEQTMYIDLIKQDTKKWVFFDDYKVAMDGAVCNDYKILAPSGLTVKIDDIEISETPIEETEETENANTSYYTVDSIFSGTHTVSITGDLIQDYSESLYIESRDTDEYSMYSDSYDEEFFDFVLKDEQVAAIEAAAPEFVTTLYQNALSGESVDTVSGSVSSTYDDFINVYERISNNSDSISNLKFSDFSVEDSSCYFSDGCFTYSFRLNFTSSFSETSWYSSEPRERTNDYSNAYMTYSYENDTWKVSSISTSYVF